MCVPVIVPGTDDRAVNRTGKVPALEGITFWGGKETIHKQTIVR